MKWWFKSRERRHSEATRARQAAEVELDRVKAETPRYEALGADLRRIRKENHLTELVLNIPRRRHP